MKIFKLFIILTILSSCTNKSSAPKEEQVETVEQSKQEPIAYKDLDVAAFANAIAEDEEGFVLDVRTPEETAQGMIEGAIELDYRHDSFKDKALMLDKNKTYYIYCRSGGRSSEVSQFLIDNGYTSIYNLEGGFNAWKEANN